MKNKIIVNELPEESLDCAFSEMVDYNHHYSVKCRVDGFMCDLDCCGHCEKLMTLEDALGNIDIPEV